MVGVNHRSAPIGVRESIAFPQDCLKDALAHLNQTLEEAVILSTCNRTEIYSATETVEEVVDGLKRFIINYRDVSESDITPFFYSKVGEEAVLHLFNVASGLDSQIVGESEILGQVRSALRIASEVQTVRVPMVGLFHAAVRVGRKTREETAVGRNPLSISFAAVQMVQRKLGSLMDKKALLVGAGEAGSLVASALKTVGVGHLSISNRTLLKAEELASDLSASTIPFDSLNDSIAESDIVILATNSSTHLINSETMAHVEMDTRDSPLFILDLSVPRDVAPELSNMNNLSLFNIDDLSHIAEENLEERKRAAEEARPIIEGEVSAFIDWWDSLDAIPTIKALRERAESIRETELLRVKSKLDALSSTEFETVDLLTRVIVNKLLHDPTLALKNSKDKSEIDVARNLFGLWDEAEK